MVNTQPQNQTPIQNIHPFIHIRYIQTKQVDQVFTYEQQQGFTLPILTKRQSHFQCLAIVNKTDVLKVDSLVNCSFCFSTLFVNDGPRSRPL